MKILAKLCFGLASLRSYFEDCSLLENLLLGDDFYTYAVTHWISSVKDSSNGINAKVLCSGHSGFTLSHRPQDKNGWYFSNSIICYCFNEKLGTFVFWLKLVPRFPIDNKSALDQMMAWHHWGTRPLSQPMLNHGYIVVWRHWATDHHWGAAITNSRNYHQPTWRTPILIQNYIHCPCNY